MPDVTISLDNHDEELAVFGSRDQLLRQVRDTLRVKVLARHGEIRVEGEDGERVEQARRVFEEMRRLYRRQRTLSPGDVTEVIDSVVGRGPRTTSSADGRARRSGSRAVRARTDGQGRYLKALRENELVFCIGPAGTGKTYLAVANAVAMLRKGQIKKLVLVRPAVEAGEHLGFLPGDLEAKINPYLRPLLDALHDLLPLRPDPPLHGQRPDRDRPAGLHAGPDAERRVHHPRRGAERDRPADEDVPDPHGPERADRRDRRHDPGGPARRTSPAGWPTPWSGCATCRGSGS